MNIQEYDKLNPGEQSLVDWQHNRSGGFETTLWALICRADTSNIERLRLGFPYHVGAYLKYTNDPDYWTKLKERLEIKQP